MHSAPAESRKSSRRCQTEREGASIIYRVISSRARRDAVRLLARSRSGFADRGVRLRANAAGDRAAFFTRHCARGWHSVPAYTTRNTCCCRSSRRERRKSGAKELERVTRPRTCNRESATARWGLFRVKLPDRVVVVVAISKWLLILDLVK